MLLQCIGLLVKLVLNLNLSFLVLKICSSAFFFWKSQFAVILGDFNARSSTWWSKNITNINGTLNDLLTTTHGFKQLISDAAHIFPQSTSCIDLIFTDQPNYIIDCGTHPSLNKNCHHQITFCKLNLKVEYPPPYQRLSGILKNLKITQLKICWTWELEFSLFTWKCTWASCCFQPNINEYFFKLHTTKLKKSSRDESIH